MNLFADPHLRKLAASFLGEAAQDIAPAFKAEEGALSGARIMRPPYLKADLMQRLLPGGLPALRSEPALQAKSVFRGAPVPAPLPPRVAPAPQPELQPHPSPMPAAGPEMGKLQMGLYNPNATPQAQAGLQAQMKDFYARASGSGNALELTNPAGHEAALVRRATALQANPAWQYGLGTPKSAPVAAPVSGTAKTVIQPSYSSAFDKVH